MTNYNFTPLDNEVLDVYGPQIGMTGYAVYCALARFAQGSGYCWPSQDTLATMLGTTRKTIRAALKKLEAAGLIEATHRFNADGQTSNGYRLSPVAKNPGAAPTAGVADLPERVARASDGPEADQPGDYEPYDPAEDDEPLAALTQGGDDMEMFRTDEDVLIAIRDIRQRNVDYLIALLEGDGEGWPTDADYPADDLAAAPDTPPAAEPIAA